MSADSYRIGEVAAATGVTVETLRFYEREGLLSVPRRSASGARRYGDDSIGRVRFIKQAQAVGLTLRDIQVLVKSRQPTSRHTCQKIRTMLAARISEIENRVRDMQAFRDVLRNHLRACDRALADQTVQECPTLDAIERGEAQRAEGTRP
jgi:MerR family Zn(II)-responsive transcriptional regulator of zntA